MMTRAGPNFSGLRARSTAISHHEPATTGSAHDDGCELGRWSFLPPLLNMKLEETTRKESPAQRTQDEKGQDYCLGPTAL